MKRLIYIFASLFCTVACLDIENGNPYEDDLHTMSVLVSLPPEFSAEPLKDITVKAENISDGNSFEEKTDASGTANFTLPNGLYRISATHAASDELFSSSQDRIRISGKDKTIGFRMDKIKTGDIVIKEIYCGGCKKLPQEGEYQADKYIILHNNTNTVQYLDGLCFGMISPPNSTATNPWQTYDKTTGSVIFPDFVPLYEAVWQFGGEGTTFPLNPGDDAVIVVCGAIDHSAQYPLSVNLNHEDYFVCYNTTYFTNTMYHPAPGDKIRQDHILNVVIKTGQSNAYPLSLSSPGIAIFKAQGMSMQDFVQLPDNVINIPGSSNARATCIPSDWIMDAVEVFNGSSSNNIKRFAPSLDSGYITLSGTYLGHSLMRRVNESKTLATGHEVLVDTNNSANDFYETEKQSLRVNMEGDGNE